MNRNKQQSFNIELPAVEGVHVAPFQWNGGFLDLSARFAHLTGTVALVSGGDLDCSRYQVLGVWPWLTIVGRRGRVGLILDGKETVLECGCLEALRFVVDAIRLPEGDWPQPLAAGLLGYLAYDLKDELETLPRTSVDDLVLPHLLLYAHSVVIVHDRNDGAMQLMAPYRQGGEREALLHAERFRNMAAMPPAREGGFATPARGPVPNFDQASYERSVQQVIDYIAAGDVYQVNLSQRFQTQFRGNAFALFEQLFRRNPAPFYAFIQAGDHQIVSTSPERFLLQKGELVETRPIKGTRPRGETEEKDMAMREQLAGSAKDDAELSMIVDLLRNDLGKVCRAGSVRVVQHKRMEAYENVYHLVSVVTGELDAGQNSVDLIAATFPGGSITGCPKVRAMEIIDELEPNRRHVYCGSIGYISFHDTMDLSIAIRTATITAGMLSFSVGGGIVYDSDPRKEYEETLHKGRTLMDACKSATFATEPESMVWLNGRLLPLDRAGVSIADQGLQYGYGFFETIRVDQGRAPLLAEHLSRFERSWRELMPGPEPDVSWDAVISQVVSANALDQTCAAVKLLAARGSRSEPPWDHNLLVTARPYVHRLKDRKIEGLRIGSYPHPRQSPLAAHKTLNYLFYLRAGQWAARNGFDEALIYNPDQSVSETNTANLLLVNGKGIVRPASSAVLPGVMAAVFIRILTGWGYHVAEQRVTAQMLLSADQLLATNALMGAVPVVSIDGRSRPAGDDLWQRLNDAVIAGWRKDFDIPADRS